MSKEPKDVTIENSAFSLTIHWNPEVMLTQLCILVVCILGIVLVPNPALKTLAKVALVIDLASVFISLFMKKDKGDESSKAEKPKQEKSTNKPSNEKPAEVETKSTGHSSTYTESGNVVKNKLTVATPKPSSQQAKPVVAPVHAPTPTQVEAENSPESSVREIPEEIRGAFDSFFNMDLDDE